MKKTNPRTDLAAASTGSGQSYTVSSGDSLWKIAQKQYGDGSKWKKIYRGTVTAEEVEAKFDYWWSIASGKTEDEAEDDDAESKGLPTLAERVSIMEDAVAALAEVILDAE